MLGIGLSVPQIAGSSTAFTPAALFAAGEQGVWYDPSDLSTMFQDSAGTTPVTAVEQPVGKILDKSGRGNHATQSTDPSRPLLSARVNLLTYSEDGSNAVWSTASDGVTALPTVTANQGTTISDESTAARIAFPAISGVGAFSVVFQSIATSALNYAASVWLRTESGTATVYVGGFGSVAATPVACAVTTTYQKFTFTLPGAAGTSYFIIGPDARAGSGQPTTQSAATILFGGADLRVTNVGVGLPAYQRVGAATNYNTSGFPLYLKFDGTDDSLATGSIDFSATNKMSVFAGVRKLSAIGTANILVELSADTGNPGAQPGAFLIAAPGSTAQYTLNASGTSLGTASTTDANYAAPRTDVVAGTVDIAGDTIVLRVDGTQVGTASSDLGTGNFGNYPVYIGRRNNASLPYNGNLYSLIVRGAQSTDAQIASTETYVNSKTGAY